MRTFQAVSLMSTTCIVLIVVSVVSGQCQGNSNTTHTTVEHGHTTHYCTHDRHEYPAGTQFIELDTCTSYTCSEYGMVMCGIDLPYPDTAYCTSVQIACKWVLVLKSDKTTLCTGPIVG